MDDILYVAGKQVVRDLVSKLTPLLKILGPMVKKVFISPLTRYWMRPCCSTQDHLINYSAGSYLSNLGVCVYALREFIRDSLYVRRASNFRVVCPNRMLNIRSGLSDKEAKEADGVHLSVDRYRMIAAKLEENLESDAWFTNPSGQCRGTRRSRE